MQTLENIYTFNTRNFSVSVDAMEEPFTDFSFDETGETQKAIERGDWLCFAVRATLSFRGMEIANDYLGQCIYENTRDFRDHLGVKRQNGVGSYFSQMVRNVISEGRNTLALIPKNLKTK
jgi:hypothetical protein